jgi:hypothetical protein
VAAGRRDPGSRHDGTEHPDINDTITPVSTRRDLHDVRRAVERPSTHQLKEKEMRKLTTLAVTGSIMLFLLPLFALADELQTIPIPAEEAGLLQTGDMRASCRLRNDSGIPDSYWSGFEFAYGVFSYFDPEEECGPSAYPYEITSVSFTLYDPGGYDWPVPILILIQTPNETASPCSGIGPEIGSEFITADQATFAYPNWGTVTLETPVCINEPVFIGVFYEGGAAGSTPSLLFDDNPAPDTCHNWFYLPGGTWAEWYDIWNPPVAGYPIMWADGETQSVNCGYVPCEWNPGNPYKMHYPQLPDTMGWDVMASTILMLADDWLCTESGFVTDIHFWGSWYGGVEGDIAQLNIRIYSDIPADQSTSGYSMPGTLLWEKNVLPDEFEAIPLSSQTLEGWYDPFQGIITEDDHNQYFQYNVCLDTNWFYQEEGTVYWLAIAAFTGNPDWGWKSSQSHWNDNAVGNLWPPSDFDTWIELTEPPDFSEPLDLAFVITNGEIGDCFVNVGDADGSGALDIDDVVHVIMFIFSGGAAPLPYTTASGDADCSCSVDIDDVVYLITFIFSGGPPPCSCEEWVAACGAIR